MLIVSKDKIQMLFLSLIPLVQASVANEFIKYSQWIEQDLPIQTESRILGCVKGVFYHPGTMKDL